VSMFNRVTAPPPTNTQWEGAEKEHPAIVAEGYAAWNQWEADGEATCQYRGDKRVAWLIGFYNARTASRGYMASET